MKVIYRAGLKRCSKCLEFLGAGVVQQAFGDLGRIAWRLPRLPIQETTASERVATVLES